MSLRFVLAALLAFAIAEPAHAVSPFDFLRQQRQKQEKPRRPPPPAVIPDPSLQPGTATDATVPPNAVIATPVAPAKAGANTPPPPYEKDMRRIGEILGALHYLRPLCGADDGLAWRDKMAELIDAEGGPPDRRERLAGAFNQGYSGFQLTYRTCTPSADLAVRRYLEEGAKLTREIATRHGN